MRGRSNARWMKGKSDTRSQETLLVVFARLQLLWNVTTWDCRGMNLISTKRRCKETRRSSEHQSETFCGCSFSKQSSASICIDFVRSTCHTHRTNKTGLYQTRSVTRRIIFARRNGWEIHIVEGGRDSFGSLSARVFAESVCKRRPLIVPSRKFLDTFRE